MCRVLPSSLDTVASGSRPKAWLGREPAGAACEGHRTPAAAPSLPCYVHPRGKWPLPDASSASHPKTAHPTRVPTRETVVQRRPKAQVLPALSPGSYGALLKSKSLPLAVPQFPHLYGRRLVLWCLRLIFVSSRPSRTRETERRPAGYPRQGSVRPDRPLVRVGPSLGQRSDLGTGPAPELWGHSRDHGGRSPRAPLLGREGERHAKTATRRRGEAGAPGGGHGTCEGPGVGTDVQGCRGRGAGAAGRRG